MGIMVIVQTKIKSDFTSEFKSYLANILPDTRAFDGCNSIEMFSEIDDENNVVFVSNWDSQEHYRKYHAWRTETGVIGKIRSMADGASSIRFLKKIDV